MSCTSRPPDLSCRACGRRFASEPSVQTSAPRRWGTRWAWETPKPGEQRSRRPGPLKTPGQPRAAENESRIETWWRLRGVFANVATAGRTKTAVSEVYRLHVCVVHDILTGRGNSVKLSGLARRSIDAGKGRPAPRRHQGNRGRDPP